MVKHHMNCIFFNKYLYSANRLCFCVDIFPLIPKLSLLDSRMVYFLSSEYLLRLCSSQLPPVLGI